VSDRLPAGRAGHADTHQRRPYPSWAVRLPGPSVLAGVARLLSGLLSEGFRVGRKYGL